MFKKYIKAFVTLAAVIIAALLVWFYFSHYLRNPWTRDGQVQAYVVGVAARVSGPIIDVPFKDNQYVTKGDLLFVIDPTDYQQTLDSAQAALNKAKTSANLLRLEVERRTQLMEEKLISLEDYQILQAKYAEAMADIEVAQSLVNMAELNLSYTQVYATVTGYITNLAVTRGTYVSEGQPILALIDAENYWVTGYFRETELKHIAAGDYAEVRFMGSSGQLLHGVVESVGWGIFRLDGSSGENLLPAISPTVDWVRLAQRFPVRIKLTDPPADMPLRVGFTTSVLIRSAKDYPPRK